MALPDGSVQLPDTVSLVRPDGTVSFPDGTTQLADGTLQLASGEIMRPVAATVPAGAVALADGSVRLANGSVVLPSGSVLLPSGTSVESATGEVFEATLVLPSAIVNGARAMPVRSRNNSMESHATMMMLTRHIAVGSHRILHHGTMIRFQKKTTVHS